MPFDARPEKVDAPVVPTPAKAPTVRDIIERARDIISDKRKWTRMAFARDAEGRATSTFGDDAEKFCALGVIDRSAMELGLLGTHVGNAARLEMDNAGWTPMPVMVLNDLFGRHAVLRRMNRWLRNHPA